MKVGLVGDSHGNVEALARALGMLEAAGAERVFFLGGLFADLEGAAEARRAAAARPPAAPPREAGFLEVVEGALAQRVLDEEAEATAQWLSTRVVRVASRECPEALAGAAPRKVFEMVEGLICCLVHDKGELTREDIANATLVFHGSSGAAGLVAIGPRVFATPGHLRALDPDGRPPTFALLEVSPPALELTVFAASGELVRRERAEIATRQRMTVR